MVSFFNLNHNNIVALSILKYCNIKEFKTSFAFFKTKFILQDWVQVWLQIAVLDAILMQNHFRANFYLSTLFLPATTILEMTQLVM